MEEIIKEIAQIDSVAVSNRMSSQQVLEERRRGYEQQIETYHQETIQKARERAEKIYNEIIMAGETRCHVEADQSRESVSTMQNRYFEVEKILLNEVFDELFGVEG